MFSLSVKRNQEEKQVKKNLASSMLGVCVEIIQNTKFSQTPIINNKSKK